MVIGIGDMAECVNERVPGETNIGLRVIHSWYDVKFRNDRNE